MAKFLGLFDYNKEGPGIEKDAPKKKTFIVFFETFFRNIWKFIFVNAVYLLVSIPVLTNGLANAGITNVTRNIARDKHSFGVSDFFETIKKNFKQSLICGIINELIYAVIFFAFRFYKNNGGAFSVVGLGICLASFIIFTFMNFYIWTLIITFDFSIKQIYSNSFKFAFINFKGNIIAFASILLIFAVNFVFLMTFQNLRTVLIEALIFILCYPSFRFLLVQYCTFPAIKKFIIDPYYKEHPELDIQKRKDLGIDVDE